MTAGETLLREGAANLQRGMEAVGGRLFLTDRRLLFRSHGFNVQDGDTEIPLARIRGARPCWARLLGVLPLLPNSLAVATDERDYRFVLFGRRQWLAAIEAQVPAAGR
ncbi:MAG TPA: hypothetical protein DD456_08765 [Stenotrophomonas sp.]|nr:hypothetical protein [Stenotrophomonas sp.]